MRDLQIHQYHCTKSESMNSHTQTAGETRTKENVRKKKKKVSYRRKFCLNNLFLKQNKGIHKDVSVWDSTVKDPMLSIKKTVFYFIYHPHILSADNVVRVFVSLFQGSPQWMS